MKRVVVFAEQRTGSNFLMAQLGQHPQVLNCGELLNPKSGSPKPPGLKREEFAALRANDPWSLIVDYTFNEAAWRKPDRVIMFKFQYHNLKAKRGQEVFEGLRRQFSDLYCVHLIRANAFERLVSKINAEKTGKYFQRAGDELRRPPDPYPIEFTEAKRQMRKYLHDVAEVRKKLRLFSRCHEVTYEELVEDRKSALDRICAFFGIDYVEVVPKTQKQSLEPRFQIRNYAKLRNRFANTEFAKFFPEGPGY